MAAVKIRTTQAPGVAGGWPAATDGWRLAGVGCWLCAALVFALPSPPAQGQVSQTPPSEAASLSDGQMRELFQRVADADLQNDKKQRNYTYTMHRVEHKLDTKGQVKSSESKTFEVMELYGEQVRRLVARNDQPLSADDARKEEAKIQKLVARRANESESDRRKRQDKEAKARDEDRRFVREVWDAYRFRLAGTESPEGRETYVIDGEPRPGYQPHMKEARILPKFRFRAWIDKSASQWRKLDIQCIDTVSFGLVVARLHKGSSIVIEQMRINDEVWLPQHVALKVDARLALLKNFNLEEDVTFRDYKKFSAETKITPGGEVLRKD